MSHSDHVALENLFDALLDGKLGKCIGWLKWALVSIILGTFFIAGIWYQNQAALARLAEIQAAQSQTLQAHTHALTEHAQLLAILEDRSNR